MAASKRTGKLLDFYSGNQFEKFTGTSFTSGTTYYEQTSENNYVKTNDTSYKGKDYYIKNSFLTNEPKVAGSVYFAVDPSKKTGAIYYDVDESNRVLMSNTSIPTVFDAPIFFTANSQIRLENQNDATFSLDVDASICTYGGIAVGKTLAAGKVRIDDNGNTKGLGCEIIYNTTTDSLEFQFV